MRISNTAVVTFWASLLVAVTIIACGSKRNKTMKPLPPQSNIVNLSPVYTHVSDLDGEVIPHSKLPSTLIANALIDTCKTGAIPFLDHCYDNIHLSDEIAGFRLESLTRSFVLEESVDASFLGAMEKLSVFSRDKFTIADYDHRITFACKAGAGWCAPPSIIKHGLSVMHVGESSYINSLMLDTVFTWGGQHIWSVKGTIRLNGKIYLLPLTRAQVKRAYGDKMVNRTVAHGRVITTFIFADTQPESAQMLTGISYLVDNYTRAAALRENNGSVIKTVQR